MVSVTFKGQTYQFPSPGEAADWGVALNAYLTAIAAAFPTTALVGYGVAGSAGVTGSQPLSSDTGYSLVANADPAGTHKAALRLVPQAQPAGPNAVGDLYMTTAGVLKSCTVAGSPGTWVSVGAQT